MSSTVNGRKGGAFQRRPVNGIRKGKPQDSRHFFQRRRRRFQTWQAKRQHRSKPFAGDQLASPNSRVLLAWSRQLPLYGRIKRIPAHIVNEGHYWYLKLGHQWQQLQPRLIHLMRQLFHKHPVLAHARQRFLDEVPSKFDETEFVWLKAQSPQGLHITLDKTSPKVVRAIDQRLAFQMFDPGRLHLFPVKRRLYRSGFSPQGTHVYPLVWILWNVQLPRSFGCQHECHISVGIYAAKQRHRTFVPLPHDLSLDSEMTDSNQTQTRDDSFSVQSRSSTNTLFNSRIGSDSDSETDSDSGTPSDVDSDDDDRYRPSRRSHRARHRRH